MATLNDTRCLHSQKASGATNGKTIIPLPQTPIAPTLSLPPLGRLSTHSAEQIHRGLYNLRNLYFPSSSPTQSREIIGSSSLSLPMRSIYHIIHDTSVPDSGYASAEEEDDMDDLSDFSSESNAELDILRADPLERTFAIKWVTGFVSRSDMWACAGDSDAEAEERADSLEEAIALLSAFNGNEDEEDVALTRTFTFNLGTDEAARKGNGATKKEVHVELNDAPLSKEDHTSVGLQSWGSCILFAERICSDPAAFSLLPPPPTSSSKSAGPLRILELGAGTGMLSIIAAKILRAHSIESEIIATDYHAEVLSNLRSNVETNFTSSSSPNSALPVSVTHLDWEHPTYFLPAFQSPFDVILAADVIYHPEHARWIKRVVERLLHDRGVFWLFIPVRTTGRHEGMAATVEVLFPGVEDEDENMRVPGSEGGSEGKRLGIVRKEVVARRDGVGRADEAGYRLFKICWV